MDYEGYFKRLDALHTEGRYPVFAYLERRCSRFRAFMITASARSKDYLGVGQHSVAGGDAGDSRMAPGPLGWPDTLSPMLYGRRLGHW